MRKTFGLACGLLLATTGLARAQVATTTTTTTAPDGSTQIRRVSQLIGSNVHLQGANGYGKIEDVVLNENGAPGYLVVANNGRYAMLPWNAANINYGQRVVNYNVTPQAIQPLFFGANAWPTVTDQQFTNRMNQVFPNTGVVRREVLRPVEGTPVVPAAGAPGTSVKEKVKPNGTVKIKERQEP